MKKRIVKWFLIVIALGVALATVAILLWPPRLFRLPTFRFLEGREPTTRWTVGCRTEVDYHLEGDFKDVCAEVDAELMAFGGWKGWKCVSDLPGSRTYERRRAYCIYAVAIDKYWCGDGCVYVVVAMDCTAYYYSRRRLQRLIWRVRSRLEGALW